MRQMHAPRPMGTRAARLAAAGLALGVLACEPTARTNLLLVVMAPPIGSGGPETLPEATLAWASARL